MSGHTVRQEFIREFRGLGANSRLISVTIAASYLLQLLAAMAVGYWLLQLPVTVATGLSVALAMLFIGTRLRGFNNIVHECTHFAFSRRRQDNIVLGSVCASLVLASFRDYRDEHMTHHAHVGDYDKDLDLQGIRALQLENPLTPRAILRHILTPLFGLHLPYYFSVNLSGRDGAPYRALKLGLVGAAAIFLVLDPLAALLLVWVPFVWVYTAINYWTDCVDHGGLVGARDELDASRNVKLPRRLRPILFPRNDCFHLVHHLFPQVPVHHFDACHERLMTHPDYRARVQGVTDAGHKGNGNMVAAS